MKKLLIVLTILIFNNIECGQFEQLKEEPAQILKIEASKIGPKITSPFASSLLSQPSTISKNNSSTGIKGNRTKKKQTSEVILSNPKHYIVLHAGSIPSLTYLAGEVLAQKNPETDLITKTDKVDPTKYSMILINKKNKCEQKEVTFNTVTLITLTNTETLKGKTSDNNCYHPIENNAEMLNYITFFKQNNFDIESMINTASANPSSPHIIDLLKVAKEAQLTKSKTIVEDTIASLEKDIRDLEKQYTSLKIN